MSERGIALTFILMKNIFEFNLEALTCQGKRMAEKKILVKLKYF